MKHPRVLTLIAASAAASLPLAAMAPGLATAAGRPATSSPFETAATHGAPAGRSAPARHRPAATSAHLFAGAKAAARARVTAPWLPNGCKLVEIGPANAGYTAAQMCALPKGFHLRRGYMLVRGSIKPTVHTSSGASG